jgi:hypothetical protein
VRRIAASLYRGVYSDAEPLLPALEKIAAARAMHSALYRMSKHASHMSEGVCQKTEESCVLDAARMRLRLPSFAQSGRASSQSPSQESLSRWWAER